MNRGAWQATVDGVTKSETQLSDSHTHIHTHTHTHTHESELEAGGEVRQPQMLSSGAWESRFVDDKSHLRRHLCPNLQVKVVTEALRCEDLAQCPQTVIWAWRAGTDLCLPLITVLMTLIHFSPLTSLY